MGQGQGEEGKEEVKKATFPTLLTMVVAVSCCRTQEARLSQGHLGFMRQGHPLSYYIKHKTHICHLHVYHNASCLPPKILHNLFLKFLLDVVVAPGEIILRTIPMRKCYLFIYFVFFWGGGGGGGKQGQFERCTKGEYQNIILHYRQ